MLNVRSTLITARHELAESLRSRKAIVLLVLYVAGAIVATWLFSRLLLETYESLQAATKDATGVEVDVAAAVRESDSLRELVTDLVEGDEALASELLRIHPLGLFYGWIALTFVPLLVFFTSATTITHELATGSARFVLTRADRLSWATGKLAGQSLLMATGLLAGGAGAALVGMRMFPDFEPAAMVGWILWMSARAWVFGLAYLGILLGISQLTTSEGKARALCLVGLVALGLLRGAIGAIAEQPNWAWVDYLGYLLPGRYGGALWHPDITVRAPAMAALVAIGGVAFLAGHQRLARRDA